MDAGVKAVYDTVTDRGPGVHIMTGPISVKGAEPGDTLMVRILKTEPRLSYGSNIAAHWGYLYNTFQKERITIYKIDTAAALAYPAFAYDFKGRPIYDKPGFVTAPDPASREKIKSKVAIPLRPHFGVMGVAPGESGRINSIPPVHLAAILTTGASVQVPQCTTLSSTKGQTFSSGIPTWRRETRNYRERRSKPP